MQHGVRIGLNDLSQHVSSVRFGSTQTAPRNAVDIDHSSISQSLIVDTACWHSNETESCRHEEFECVIHILILRCPDINPSHIKSKYMSLLVSKSKGHQFVEAWR